MSYCPCPHCGSPLNCSTVKGVHVEGPCSAGCDGKPRQREAAPQPLVIEETYTARRQRAQMRERAVRRNRSRAR